MRDLPIEEGTTDAPELRGEALGEIHRALGTAAAHCDIDRLAGRPWQCLCPDCITTRQIWARRTNLISGHPQSPTAEQVARAMREQIPTALIAPNVARLLLHAGFPTPTPQFTMGLEIGFRLANLMREEQDADPHDDALRL